MSVGTRVNPVGKRDDRRNTHVLEMRSPGFHHAGVAGGHIRIRPKKWVGRAIRESDRTPYAYTIGLHPRGLPELLVTGMPPQRATHVLNSVAEYLVGGGKPVPGERILIGE